MPCPDLPAREPGIEVKGSTPLASGRFYLPTSNDGAHFPQLLGKLYVAENEGASWPDSGSADHSNVSNVVVPSHEERSFKDGPL